MLNLALRNSSREFCVYVMLSETPTRFGWAIRRFGNIKYNHASIAFDDEFRQLYSFGRRKNENPLSAGLVREHIDRFTLCRNSFVNVRIYKISVTPEQYLKGKKRLVEISRDSDGYLYNLFSVLSYPMLRGFETYKAYTCAEFVAHMLSAMEILPDNKKLCCEFTPEDIGKRIGSKMIFEGNLLEFCRYRPKNAASYFEHVKYSHVAKTSFSVTCRLIYRMIKYRANAYN